MKILINLPNKADYKVYWRRGLLYAGIVSLVMSLPSNCYFSNDEWKNTPYGYVRLKILETVKRKDNYILRLKVNNGMVMSVNIEQFDVPVNNLEQTITGGEITIKSILLESLLKENKHGIPTIYTDEVLNETN